MDNLEQMAKNFLNAPDKYSFLKSMSFDDVKNLLTLMYIGRDNIYKYNPDKLTLDSFKEELDSLSHFDKKEVCIESIYSKKADYVQMYFEKVISMI